MKKFADHIMAIVVITLLLIFACGVMKCFDNIFNTDILDSIQIAAGLVGLLVSLYRHKTNKKR